MHAEGKKATKTSKAADNKREGVLYLNYLIKAMTCTQFDIRHLIKLKHVIFFLIGETHLSYFMLVLWDPQ
jgi:hypothetical protein